MTFGYPLRWPEGWPRSARKDSGARFARGHGLERRGISAERAFRMLYSELEKLGAENVVVTVDTVPRADGTPRLDRLNDTAVALFFNLSGRPVTMAQDMFDNLPSNVRSLSMAIEALRALERHGGGTMMSKAFDGFAMLPPPRRPWKDVLDFRDEEVAAGLTADDVEAAYKRKARFAHPDRGGGSTRAMQELQQAREDALKDVGP